MAPAKFSKEEMKQLAESIVSALLKRMPEVMKTYKLKEGSDYGCTGSEFNCTKTYTCSAPDYCTEKFTCGQYSG